MITPRGLAVDPEVYWRNAGSSGSVGSCQLIELGRAAEPTVPFGYHGMSGQRGRSLLSRPVTETTALARS